ncbi:MAG: hypothetical protein ACREPN_12675 [Rudaea sp.]
MRKIGILWFLRAVESAQYRPFFPAPVSRPPELRHIFRECSPVARKSACNQLNIRAKKNLLTLTFAWRTFPIQTQYLVFECDDAAQIMGFPLGGLRCAEAENWTDRAARGRQHGHPAKGRANGITQAGNANTGKPPVWRGRAFFRKKIPHPPHRAWSKTRNQRVARRYFGRMNQQ